MCLSNYFVIIVDTDECLTTTNCDQQRVCTNTRGSFMCSCHVGYTGDSTEENCIGILCKILLNFIRKAFLIDNYYLCLCFLYCFCHKLQNYESFKNASIMHGIMRKNSLKETLHPSKMVWMFYKYSCKMC